MSKRKIESHAINAVLLVEDDDGDALLVEELLAESHAGVTIERARSVAEGRALLAEPDAFMCALVDLGLPDAEGLSALHDLRLVGGGLPIIVLTGVRDPAQGDAAVAAGAADFLVKGQVDGSALTRAMRFAVERRRAQDNDRRLLAIGLQQAENLRLERGLLPRPALRTSGLLHDTVYRPGGGASVLGGDFYDTVEGDDGSLRLIVGDVCGHGAEEAAVGVALRVAWRAFVLAGGEAHRVLPLMDEMLRLEHGDDLFVTVVEVAISADRTELRYRLAGHWPPLLFDGTAWRLLPNHRRGMPLGLEHDRWDVHVESLPPTGALLLFTDGLIEGRAGEGRLGVEGLTLILNAVGDPWPLADVVNEVERCNGGPVDDDIAAVLFRWSRSR